MFKHAFRLQAVCDMSNNTLFFNFQAKVAVIRYKSYYGHVLINFTIEPQQFLELSQQDPNHVQNCFIHMPTQFHKHKNHNVLNCACLYL